MQLALKLLLRRAYGGQLPIKVLRNETVLKQLNKHPDLMVDLSLFEIKEQMKELSSIMYDINQQANVNSKVQEITNEFVKSFDSLKKIPAENMVRHQVILHKRFGDFNLLYVAKMAEG